MNKMLIFFFLSLYFHTPHAVIINLYDVVGKFKGEKKKNATDTQEVFACENEKLCCVGYLMLFEFFFVLFYLSITY